MTEPAAARRTRFLDAADTVVAREGSGASMSAIAAAAGITKPVLYRVFGDRDGLFRALLERHSARLLEQLQAALATPGPLRERTRRTVDTYLALVESSPATYRALMTGDAARDPGVQGQVASFLRRFGELLTAGIRVELRLPPHEPAPVAAVWAHGIVGMVQAAGDWWLDHPDAVSRAELVEELTELLWGGLPARARA